MRLHILRLNFGQDTTGREQAGSDASRRDVVIWACVIIFVNQLVNVIKEMPSVSIDRLVADLCSIGVFQYLAWYAIFRLLTLSERARLARWWEILVIAVFCLLVFIPTSRMIWVAATGLAVYICVVCAGDLRLRASGIVLFALAIQEFWGHVFFQLIALPLLHVETAVVGSLLDATLGETSWHDNVITTRNGHGILIYPYCSSFHNVSLALLCWVTVTRLRDLSWRKYDFLIAGAVAGTMVLFNVIRLYLMALDIDSYHYWHSGTGQEIFAIGASLTILLLALYGSKPIASNA